MHTNTRTHTHKHTDRHPSLTHTHLSKAATSFSPCCSPSAPGTGQQAQSCRCESLLPSVLSPQRRALCSPTCQAYFRSLFASLTFCSGLQVSPTASAWGLFCFGLVLTLAAWVKGTHSEGTSWGCETREPAGSGAADLPGPQFLAINPPNSEEFLKFF